MRAEERASTGPSSLGRLKRRPELDALRGLFLVWMTLAHLPTRLSDLVNQPFGYVSSAEGFVFLSGLLVSSIYIRRAVEKEAEIRSTLWLRAFRLYCYHLLLLSVTFTAVAVYAVRAHRPALTNLMSFYLAHPAPAAVGSIFLAYCPPLLDILPMYILFLLMSPFLLSYAARRGWTAILVASGTVWLLAQFGLRSWVHGGLVHLTHMQIPLQETGAFNLFSWQLVWIGGMALGSAMAQGNLPFVRLPRPVFPISAAICLFFVAVRHDWLKSSFGSEALAPYLDKWQIAPLRLVNLIAFSCVLYWMRNPVRRLVTVEPFLTLGKASLEVFCAHIIFVFFGLGLLTGEMTQLHGVPAVMLVALTFSGLMLVALRQVRRRQIGPAVKTQPDLQRS